MAFASVAAKRWSTVSACCAALACSPAASAAGENQAVLLGTYTFGGEFEDSATGEPVELAEEPSVLIALDRDYEANTELEFLFAREPTSLQPGGNFTGSELFDIDVTYLHFGGTLLLEGQGVQPFIVGTLGLTHLNPAPSDLDAETRFSMSLGGGWRWWLAPTLALRLEGRAWATLLDSDGAIFCAGGACNLRVSGELFMQYTVGAGLNLRF